MKLAILFLILSTIGAQAGDVDAYGCALKNNLHRCTATNTNVVKMRCNLSPCYGAVDPTNKPGELHIFQTDSDGFVYIPRVLLHKDHDRLLKGMREVVE